MLFVVDCYDYFFVCFWWDFLVCYNIGVDVCDKWVDGSGCFVLIYEMV